MVQVLIGDRPIQVRFLNGGQQGLPGDPGGNIESVGLFDDIGTLTIPAGTDRITTSGYAAEGIGAATYVSDATADAAYAAAHPLATAQSADGRYWRLMPVNGTVDIRQLGADSAALDNKPAVIEAMKQAAHVIIPEGSFGCSSGILVQQDGQTVTWAGKLVMNSGQTGALFDTNGYRVALFNPCLDGSAGGSQVAVASSTANRSGLMLDYDKNSIVVGGLIEGFANVGVLAGNAASSRTGNCTVSGVIVRNCWTGFDIGQVLGEYTTWTGCKASGCRYGVVLSSGNISWVGGSINDNYRNVWLLGTGVANNSHGSMVGTLINHATEAVVFADGVDFGFIFTGCNMHQGELILNNCKGVLVAGNVLDLDAMRFGGATGDYNRVCNNTIIGSYANTVQMNYGGTISPTELYENYKLDGTLFEQHRVPIEGNSVFTSGDQTDRLWSENGSLGTDGWEWTSNGGTGDLKLYPYTGGARGSTPAFTFNRVSGKLTQMMASLSNYADDAAAAAGGVPIGGLYRNGSVVMQRVA